MSAAPEPVQLDAWEELQRQAVMEGHEIRHKERLRVIRDAMASLYRHRLTYMRFEVAVVSGNDVRRWLERHPEWDKPGASANWRAAVFTSKEWEWSGQLVESTAPGGHRTPLKTYRLRER